jgi:hypothetical protein
MTVQSRRRVFERVATGRLRPRIRQRWALPEYNQAHRAPDTGSTSGASILVP